MNLKLIINFNCYKVYTNRSNNSFPSGRQFHSHCKVASGFQMVILNGDQFSEICFSKSFPLTLKLKQKTSLEVKEN